MSVPDGKRLVVNTILCDGIARPRPDFTLADLGFYVAIKSKPRDTSRDIDVMEREFSL